MTAKRSSSTAATTFPSCTNPAAASCTAPEIPKMFIVFEYYKSPPTVRVISADTGASLISHQPFPLDPVVTFVARNSGARRTVGRPPRSQYSARIHFPLARLHPFEPPIWQRGGPVFGREFRDIHEFSVLRHPQPQFAIERVVELHAKWPGPVQQFAPEENRLLSDVVDPTEQDAKIEGDAARYPQNLPCSSTMSRSP